VSTDSEFVEIGTTSSNVVTFEDDDFDSNTTYFYRVRALSSPINSAFSEIFSLVTLPFAPTLLATTDVDTDGFTINWEVIDEASSFEVDISTDDFVTFVDGFENAVSETQSFNVIGLSPANYQYRVRSTNASGASPNSETGTSVVITGLQDQLVNTFQLKLYPNPATDELNLQVPSKVIGDVRLTIYDFRGRVVLDQATRLNKDNLISLNISELNLGIYVVVLQGEEEFSRSQFVKMN